MQLRSSICLVVLLILGCQTPIDKQPPKEIIYLPPVIHDSTDITDENILRAVYSDYKFPEGFYQEDFKGGSPYYENTISIRTEKDHWFELSTNDRDQAFAWSESSSVKSAYYRTLESERQTEKFFEFRRVWLEHPTDILLSRVHKANYLDRSMFDRFFPRDTLGILRTTTIDTTKAREVVEYLWHYDNYNFGGSKILHSYVTDRNDFVQYTLFYTSVSYGDWGLCDRIGAFRRVFKISKLTGAITRDSAQMLKLLDGECH